MSNRSTYRFCDKTSLFYDKALAMFQPMPEWEGFLYPPVTSTDIARELYLTSMGRMAYVPNCQYPALGHPPEYQFLPNYGRELGDFAIVWIERGSGFVTTASAGSLPLGQGHVLLLPPGARHDYRPDAAAGWVERWVCANGVYLHRLRIKDVFPSSPEIRLVRNIRSLASAFDQLRLHAESNSLLVSALTLAVVAEALGETQNHPQSGEPAALSGDLVVDAAVLHIWANCHRSLDVGAIARHVGISRRMLERRFAGTWPRSVAREITLARVHRGRELLAENSLTVKEAGYAAGFGGARRFIAAYRRLLGTTPGRERGRRLN
ncbi:MAG: helix-turn-helix domain-containing protein [Verrucomicrobiota bacterium]